MRTQRGNGDGMQNTYNVDLDLRDGFAFDVTFESNAAARLRLDERPPLGAGTGPDGTTLALAAVGHSLGSAFVFALLRAHAELAGLQADVRGRVVRGGDGRDRIAEIRVQLRPRFATPPAATLGARIAGFEDACVLVQSLRDGVDINVDVVWPGDGPANGHTLNGVDRRA